MKLMTNWAGQDYEERGRDDGGQRRRRAAEGQKMMGNFHTTFFFFRNDFGTEFESTI